MKFDVYYMLDPAGPCAAARKGELIDTFRKQFSAGWELYFVDVPDVRDCFRRGLQSDSHLAIAEDGVHFLPRMEQYLLRCIDNIAGSPWDLVYTDIVFVDPDEVFRLFRPQEEMLRLNNLQIHYLTGVDIIGGSCFVINKWSKHKVWQLLEAPDAVDLPAEIVLRRLSRAGEIKASMLFPFATSQLPIFAERRIYVPDPPIDKRNISPGTFDIL